MEDTMRIAYASDFSPASRAAFSMALRLTRATGGELTILHALLSPASMFVTGNYVTKETWELIEAEQRSMASQEMDALIKEAWRLVCAPRLSSSKGIPADGIV